MQVRILFGKFGKDGLDRRDVEVLRLPNVGEVITFDTADGLESWTVTSVEHFPEHEPPRAAVYVEKLKREFAPITNMPWPV